jgi:hypothetical protein
MHWTFESDVHALSRLYWTYSGGPPSAADCTTLAQDLGAAWVSHCIALYGSSGGLLSVFAQDLASLSGASGIYPTNTSGTRSGAALPTSTCALINYTISRRYRGGKPRSYVPFGTDSDISTGVWTSAFQTAVTTGWAAMIAAFVGASSGTTAIAAHANVSYYQGYNPPTVSSTNRAKNHPKLRAAPVVDVISSATCNALPGTQRRRYNR